MFLGRTRAGKKPFVRAPYRDNSIYPCCKIESKNYRSLEFCKFRLNLPNISIIDTDQMTPFHFIVTPLSTTQQVSIFLKRQVIKTAPLAIRNPLPSVGPLISTSKKGQQNEDFFFLTSLQVKAVSKEWVELVHNAMYELLRRIRFHVVKGFFFFPSLR